MITLKRTTKIIRRYAFPRLGLDQDTILEVAADGPVNLTAWAAEHDVEPDAVVADLSWRSQFKADLGAGRLVLSGAAPAKTPTKRKTVEAAATAAPAAGA